MERRGRQSTPVGTGAPWLVIPCGKGFKNQTFCTIGSNVTSVELKSIPELRGHQMWACHHGWLLLSTDDYHLWSLWNPITYDLINLPSLPLELINCMDIRSCIFTASPKKLECKVVIFDYSSTTMLYCQPGDQHWTQHDYGRGLVEFEGKKYKVITIRAMACLDGVIYGVLFGDGYSISIEFDNQTAQVICKIIGLKILNSRMFTVCSNTYLVESFGELYAFEKHKHAYNEEVIAIDVFRWDFCGKCWVEVENLGHRSIFLNRWNGTSCLEMDTGISGNRIYYISPQDKHLYVYDLEKRTILNLLPCPRLQTPWYQPFWVMPEYTRTDIQLNMKPEYSVCPVLERPISPTDIKFSADQCPHNISLDTLTKIARNLEPLDYLNFRATCRLFRSSAPSTQWSLSSIVSVLESPCLVTTFANKENIFSFTDPKNNKTYSMKVPESLQGTLISGSKDGNLLMFEGKNLYYFNPFTKKQVKLPMPSSYDNRLSFSSSPSSSDCLALKINQLSLTVVEFLYQGEDHWNREILEDCYKHSYDIKEPGVFHDGNFYFLRQRGDLGVINIEHGFSWEILVEEAPCNSFYHTYLMECNGELMSVFVGRYGNWVQVFKFCYIRSRLDPSIMIWDWKRVKSLGCYTLFVSNLSSIATIARSSEMENRIYFPRFYDQRIIYYSLQTEKLHTHGSEVVLDNFINTKEQLYSTWIYPGRLE